jgi:hypothetical protein
MRKQGLTVIGSKENPAFEIKKVIPAKTGK